MERGTEDLGEMARSALAGDPAHSMGSQSDPRHDLLHALLFLMIHLKRMVLGVGLSLLGGLLLFGVTFIVEDISGKSYDESMNIVGFGIIVLLACYVFGYIVLEESSR